MLTTRPARNEPSLRCDRDILLRVCFLLQPGHLVLVLVLLAAWWLGLKIVCIWTRSMLRKPAHQVDRRIMWQAR